MTTTSILLIIFCTLLFLGCLLTVYFVVKRDVPEDREDDSMKLTSWELYDLLDAAIQEENESNHTEKSSLK